MELPPGIAENSKVPGGPGGSFSCFSMSKSVNFSFKLHINGNMHVQSSEDGRQTLLYFIKKLSIY